MEWFWHLFWNTDKIPDENTQCVKPLQHVATGPGRNIFITNDMLHASKLSLKSIEVTGELRKASLLVDIVNAKRKLQHVSVPRKCYSLQYPPRHPVLKELLETVNRL